MIPPNELLDPQLKEIGRNSSQGIYSNGVSLTEEEMKGINKHFAAHPNIVTSKPTIIARYGQYASIQIGGLSQGQMLSLIPYDCGRTGEIELAVSMADFSGSDLPKNE